MHLVITDSGLGGLSVCAKLMRLLKEKDSSKSIHSGSLKITYINASPSNEFGYNDMSSILQQITTFKKIINNIEHIFSPDIIFVACGTLSGLLVESNFGKDLNKNIKSIVPIGTKLLLESFYKNPKSKIIVFGTPTTIVTNIFKTPLLKEGISKNNIFSQSCPKLATKISNDLEGKEVSKLIKKFVNFALKKNFSNPNIPLIVFLGCTHYAYREDLFSMAFCDEGFFDHKILSPNNESAFFLKDLIFKEMNRFSRKKLKISVQFVTPYSIPEKEKNTLTKLLFQESQDTSLALKNENICPELLED